MSFKPALLDCLLLEDEPDRVLVALVRQIDLAFPALESKLALAKAFVAIGPAMLERGAFAPSHPTWATLRASEAFVAEPCEETWEHLVSSATQSYPFGPGDGCYSVSGHVRCDAGSGCKSGAGTIAIVASTVGAAEALDTIRVALIPWLQE